MNAGKLLISKNRAGYSLLDYSAIMSLFIIVAGLYTMEFFHILSNIGIIILVCCSIIRFIIPEEGKIIKTGIYLPREYLALLVIFFSLLINMILFTRESNFNYALSRMELYLTWIALPLGFVSLPLLERKIFHHLFFFYFLLTLLISTVCSVLYLLNMEEINYLYGRSGVIPTPVNHVRFSLMVCYAVFTGIFLMKEEYFTKTGKYLLGTGIGFLIFFLHLLAVRSGLMAFYAIVLALILYLLFNKKSRYALLLLAGMVIIAFLSWNYIKTIQIKWGYTAYDIEQSAIKESANDYSLSRRLLAHKVAISIFRQNIITGIGSGNISSEIERIYREEHPYILPENIITPHNQYLKTLAGEGITGFFIFITCFYFPLFYRRNFRFHLLSSLYILLSLSFIVEDTLETQLGLNFSVFFILINLHYINNPVIRNTT